MFEKSELSGEITCTLMMEVADLSEILVPAYWTTANIHSSKYDSVQEVHCNESWKIEALSYICYIL